jgi:hypothetical protein
MTRIKEKQVYTDIKHNSEVVIQQILPDTVFVEEKNSENKRLCPRESFGSSSDYDFQLKQNA